MAPSRESIISDGMHISSWYYSVTVAVHLCHFIVCSMEISTQSCTDTKPLPEEWPCAAQGGQGL